MSTRNSIMDVAKKLFVKNGFEGTTVRQICDEADVSVSAINYHFENKAGLFKAILSSLNTEHYNVGFEALEAPESAEGFKLRLRFFIDSYISTFLAEPEVHILLSREYEKNSESMSEYFKDRATTSYKKLLTFIEEAKYKGILNPNINSGFLAGLIFNQITSQVRVNEFSAETFGLDLNDPSFRKAWINETINIIFNGVKDRGHVSPMLAEEVQRASGE